ncbi:hypothetical protein SAMD00023353_2701540 [Rosellinia necatrix]|uniref:Uncharacterized protein n=1 Tax=Rosellinia necatrix TaxID=77044 RepID=A0A1S8A8C9_ROSNE|nr:hypothetical protein SAMD00023353_2701540 [Rosellinia necatrix]
MGSAFKLGIFTPPSSPAPQLPSSPAPSSKFLAPPVSTRLRLPKVDMTLLQNLRNKQPPAEPASCDFTKPACPLPGRPWLIPSHGRLPISSRPVTLLGKLALGLASNRSKI